MRSHLSGRFKSHQGIALISCLLILVMLTLLALTMFRSNGLQQKIAGNTREKARAYEAAQNALQFAEYYLVNGNPVTGIPCSTVLTVTTDTNLGAMRTCSNLLDNPDEPSTWPAIINYQPPLMKVATGGGSAVDGSGNADINYSKMPGLYIAYLGLAPDGQQMLYSVTAAGYGGSTSSLAVVQSVFATKSNVTARDGL